MFSRIVFMLILLCLSMGYGDETPAAAAADDADTAAAPVAAAADDADTDAAPAAADDDTADTAAAASTDTAAAAASGTTDQASGTATDTAAAAASGTTDKASGTATDNGATAASGTTDKAASGTTTDTDSTASSTDNASSGNATQHSEMIKKLLKMPPKEIVGIAVGVVAALFVSVNGVMCAKYKKGLFYMMQMKMAGYLPIPGGAKGDAAAADAAAE